MNNNTDDERKLTPLSGDDSAPGWLVLFGITGFLMGAVAMHALETPSERPAFEKETITHGNAEIASNLTADMNLSFGTDSATLAPSRSAPTECGLTPTVPGWKIRQKNFSRST